MKYTPKKNLNLFIASTCLTVFSVQAAPIISTDYDGNTVAGNIASGITYTTDAAISLINNGDLTAVTGGSGFSVAGNFSTTDTIFVNQNLNTGNAQGFYFDFSLSANVDLTDLSLTTGHLNASGGGQNFISDLNYDISVLGGSSIVSGTLTVDYAPNTTAFFTNNFDLTGNSLSSGQNYRLTVTADNFSGGGAFFAADGLTLSGDVTAIPEPSTFAIVLVPLFFGLLMRTRLKKH